jgi:hypothetical protein
MAFPEREIFVLLTWARGNVNLTWLQVLAARRQVEDWIAERVPDGPCPPYREPLPPTPSVEDLCGKLEQVYRQQEDMAPPDWLCECLGHISCKLLCAAATCVPKVEGGPNWKPEALRARIVGADGMSDEQKEATLRALGLAPLRPLIPVDPAPELEPIPDPTR